MPLHDFNWPRGQLTHFDVESEALGGNLLGDPTTRRVFVYTPAEAAAGDELPLLVDLVGFTGSGASHLNWKAFRDSVPTRVDRLIATGAMGPVVVALPDCFTSLGGNQYIDSLATGRWEEFLIAEMLPALEERYPIRRGRDHRAVFGKSSGGYGALAHGLRHAEAWGAVASHSGDVGFEWSYLVDMPGTLVTLAKHGGTIEGFLQHLAQAAKTSDREVHTLMTLAMAATYDPDPAAPKGIRLPVDLRTCQLDPERWAAWLAHDPLRMIERPECQANLRSLRGLFIDCGSRDQYHLQFGARGLVDRLSALGIEHRYEEFDDDHSDVDYRMDVSLPFLYRALTS
jgi:S-formylglutathione hydrolase FrmB